MTVAVAIRVPGKGAVLAADSRAIGHDGHIWSDDLRKIVRFPGVTVAVAGDLSVLTLLKRHDIQTCGDVRAFIEEVHNGDLDFTLLCYDRVRDRLWVMEDTGGELEFSRHAVVGSGRPFAAGALQGYPSPKNLPDAVKIAKKAAAAACALHVECGGKIRSVTSERL